MKKKIMIEGMSCGHCVTHIKEALADIALSTIDVNLEGKYAVIDTHKNNSVIIAAIDEAGYDVTNIEDL